MTKRTETGEKEYKTISLNSEKTNFNGKSPSNNERPTL